MHGPDIAVSNEMRECAHLCHECHDACLEMIPYCLGKGGEHAAPAHIALLLDCEEICQAAENLLHRGSPHHVLMCRACARICELCRDDCQRLDPRDRMMRECAEMCGTCTESCHAMVAMSGQHEHAVG